MGRVADGSTFAFDAVRDSAPPRVQRTFRLSLEGFYQETGRAGRDGNDADCVLYYHVQDASRLSSLTYAELEGQQKRAFAHAPPHLYH